VRLAHDAGVARPIGVHATVQTMVLCGVSSPRGLSPARRCDNLLRAMSVFELMFIAFCGRSFWAPGTCDANPELLVESFEKASEK
jgi:hypothetical protein